MNCAKETAFTSQISNKARAPYLPRENKLQASQTALVACVLWLPWCLGLGAYFPALIAHLRTLRPPVLCAQCSTLAQICDGLERELGLASEDLRLVKRKNRVRH